MCFFLLTFSSFLFPGMPLLLVLEVVVHPADVAGEGEGVAPEGPEVGVADDHYVCFSQRMAAATLPLSRHFQLFIWSFCRSFRSSLFYACGCKCDQSWYCIMQVNSSRVALGDWQYVAQF
jgi:hypothetical protein